MQIPIRRLIKPYILPLLLFILATIVTFKYNDIAQTEAPSAELKAFLVIFPLIPYLLFIVTALLGLRANNTGLIFAAILLAFSYAAITHFQNSTPLLSSLISFLLPINVFLWGSIRRTQLFSRRGITLLVFLALEILIVFYSGFFHDLPEVKFNFEMYREFPQFAKNLESFMQNIEAFLSTKFLVANFPQYALLLLAICLNSIFYYKREDMFFAVFTVIGITAFVGTAVSEYLPSVAIYYSACGLMLIIASIEASFSMAYIDELTNLPGRRSLNESMANLGKKYAIAMIDIDHFKKFNDTYGHKTGDQVLRMVAFKLSEVTGGAKVFRYGGEEFTAIFSGKSAAEAREFMDEYRQTIAESPFFVRSKKRRRTSREQRGKGSKNGEKQVSVTVSIGIAASSKKLNKPEKVIKAADKILYKAKNAGRNNVQI